MQLKRKLTGALSLASCSLLGLPSAQAETPWDVETAIMYYGGEDGRVSALEPILSMKKEIHDDEFLNLKFTLDSLTGASATGAVPSNNSTPQTFTTPSGNSTYDVAANETPLDPTFLDTRVQFTLGWDKPLERDLRRNLGFNVSKEYDFTSISGNASWTWDTNLKNTSYTLGGNIELDSIDPVGGAPLPLSSQVNNTPILRDGDNKTKNVIDLLAGVTQIIDRSSLVQFNLSFSMADGYLTDPYKLVSIVDSAAGPNLGEPVDQIYENRPDARQKIGLFTRYKKQFSNQDILNVSYRYMVDDWGIDSNTIDASYRWRLDNGYYIQPGLRLYDQTAADFYRYFLLDTDTIPDDLTADYRLGELTAQTVGIKFGYSGSQNSTWSVRLERYMQSGESHPDVAVGQLVNQDLYPDVDATIIQISYGFQW